jgi:hypothetical protein
MSQHDFNIANQTSAASRTDINSALTALATLSSGATAPSTTYANMLWYDTANDVLKIRNEADSNWVVVGYVNQTTTKLEVLDDTSVVSSVGIQTGLLGDQATATWEAGTGTTESLVSPAKVKAAIEALTSPGIGEGQVWSNPARVVSTSYQNTTGKPIMIGIRGRNVNTVEVSTDNSTWVIVGTLRSVDGVSMTHISAIIPNNHYYRLNGGTLSEWAELR